MKQNLRKYYKEMRDAKGDTTAADANIYKKLINCSAAYQTVFCYASYKSEAPTLTYIESLLKSGKTVCIPKVYGNIMHAVKITSLQELSPSKLGILEPIHNNKIKPSDIDLIIVPLLAFNEHNYRLGYGGGYYDQFLKGCKAKKIGIAYAFQKTDIPFEELHDIPMDEIITAM